MYLVAIDLVSVNLHARRISGYGCFFCPEKNACYEQGKQDDKFYYKSGCYFLSHKYTSVGQLFFTGLFIRKVNTKFLQYTFFYK